jgi:hypothetical protein
MNEISFLKNDISHDSENIKLPPIDCKFIPYQRNINDITKNENEDGNKLKNIKSQTFLTSKKTETDGFNVVKSKKNIISKDAIIDLLNEKIEINNNMRKYSMIFKTFNKSKSKNKKINRYINEDILKNSPIRIHAPRKKLKHIKINNLFTELNEDEKNKFDEETYFDKRLYNLRLEKFIQEEEESKKIKSVDKKEIKKKEMEYPKSDWKKKITCSLDYKFVINKYYIGGLNSLIKSMNKSSKAYFDRFKTESNDALEQIYNV